VGVASGESNRDIATRLRLSEDTIKHHMTDIFDKLGVSNRAELAAYATTRGLSTPRLLSGE
jgi:DNA-binding NarL/FixJ family response regulator